jgi:hypothetical protein
MNSICASIGEYSIVVPMHVFQGNQSSARKETDTGFINIQPGGNYTQY